MWIMCYGINYRRWPVSRKNIIEDLLRAWEVQSVSLRALNDFALANLYIVAEFVIPIVMKGTNEYSAESIQLYVRT